MGTNILLALLVAIGIAVLGGIGHNIRVLRRIELMKRKDQELMGLVKAYYEDARRERQEASAEIKPAVIETRAAVEAMKPAVDEIISADPKDLAAYAHKSVHEMRGYFQALGLKLEELLRRQP